MEVKSSTRELVWARLRPSCCPERTFGLRQAGDLLGVVC